MNRATARLVISVILVVFGGYRALFLPGLLSGSSSMLFAGFLLQAVFGIAAGFGVWRGAAWAPHVIVLLGASIAATALVEGYVLEIVAALRALLEAVVAIIACLILAAHVRRSEPAPARAG